MSSTRQIYKVIIAYSLLLMMCFAVAKERKIESTSGCLNNICMPGFGIIKMGALQPNGLLLTEDGTFLSCGTSKSFAPSGTWKPSGEDFNSYVCKANW